MARSPLFVLSYALRKPASGRGTDSESDRLRHPPAAPLRRSTDPAGSHDRRSARQTPRRGTGQLLTAPIEQSSAQELRLDSQGLADSLERERPFATLFAQPLLSFAEQPLAQSALR